jgi:hypothetical protein
MQHQALGRPRKHGLGGLSLQFEPHGVVVRAKETPRKLSRNSRQSSLVGMLASSSWTKPNVIRKLRMTGGRKYNRVCGGGLFPKVESGVGQVPPPDDNDAMPGDCVADGATLGI